MMKLKYTGSLLTLVVLLLCSLSVASASNTALCCSTLLQTVQRERAHPQSYCFYHGLSKEAFIAILANTYLDHIVNGTPISDNFVKLRHDKDLYTGPEPIDQYVHNDIHDRREPYKSNLLSVNLSFPGNVHNVTENALNYFKRDCNDSSTSYLFRKIAHMYARTEEEADRITDVLHNVYQSISQYHAGVVLQLIIPKNITSECVYISTGCGVPHAQAKKNYQYNIDVLELFQNDQEKLQSVLQQEDSHFHARGLQARIRLNASLFSQPGYIKMYAYHAFSATVYSDLYRQLRNVMHT